MLSQDLKRMAGSLAIAALLWSAAGTSSAVGADAGITVSNTATVDCSVNTAAQPRLTSNAVDFLVDRPVDLMVTPGIVDTTIDAGAIVEYLVMVTNDAGSTLSATALTILDVLPSDVTFEADTYATGKGIKLGAVAQTNIVDGDQGSESAGTVTVTVASLAPAATAVITYRVSVD
jgi:uncharacterized repeat protein (TIGR01451 family)